MADLLRIRIQSLLLSPGPARDRAFNARRAMFNEAEKRALYTPAWRDLTRNADTLSWLGETLPPPGGDRLTRWQIHDVRTSLHDEMLTKVDRATMASGVEAQAAPARPPAGGARGQPACGIEAAGWARQVDTEAGGSAIRAGGIVRPGQGRVHDAAFPLVPA